MLMEREGESLWKQSESGGGGGSASEGEGGEYRGTEGRGGGEGDKKWLKEKIGMKVCSEKAEISLQGY